jgi:hypothetical protein
MTDRHLDEVYSADTPEKAEAAYDGWASAYDADLMAMGYRLPWLFAACVLRHIPSAPARSSTRAAARGCRWSLCIFWAGAGSRASTSRPR